ncbi:MAG: hypothetical protein ACR2FY_20580 [Pirellulaceae bacterium]
MRGQKSRIRPVQSDRPDRDALAAMAGPGGFVLFCERLLIKHPKHGLVLWGLVAAPHQREWVQALAPALSDLAAGKPADDEAVRKFWLEGTKGAAKDTILAAAVLWLAVFSSQPLTIQIAAADADQSDELRKAGKTWLHNNAWLNDRAEIQNWRILGTSNGVEALIVAADVAGSHGARPDMLIVNECSHIEKWEFVENLADNASKVPHGVVIVATNAGFTNTPAFKWRELARTSPRWSYHQFDQPAPWLAADEIEEARIRNSSERFQRLWFGKWSSGNGDAIGEADIEACTVLGGPLVRNVHTRGYRFFAGLDLGISHDHAALVVLGIKSGSGKVTLANCFSWKPPRGGQINLQEVENKVRWVKQVYGIERLFYDGHQAQHMAQRLRTFGVVCEEIIFSAATLNNIAVCLMGAFKTQTLELYDDPELKRDFLRLTIEERPWGHKLTAASDVNGHADRAMATAIALPFVQKWATLHSESGWNPTSMYVGPAHAARLGIVTSGRSWRENDLRMTHPGMPDGYYSRVARER